MAEVEEIATEVYEDSIAARIWPGTRAMAQMHLDVGQQVWLVTAAPVEVAGVIAARLGLTGALGTTAEHVDGVYTGRLRGGLLHGPAKAEAVRALAHEHGFDLARCFAYSDSFNDLPMLNLVGHPCAINPDPRLLEHAEEQDWQIRDYRTGRRAARMGLLGAAGAGATAGAVATGLAVRRRLRADRARGSVPSQDAAQPGVKPFGVVDEADVAAREHGGLDAEGGGQRGGGHGRRASPVDSSPMPTTMRVAALRRASRSGRQRVVGRSSCRKKWSSSAACLRSQLTPERVLERLLRHHDVGVGQELPPGRDAAAGSVGGDDALGARRAAAPGPPASR